MSSSSTTGSSGCLGAADEPPPAHRPRLDVLRLLDRGAQRERLEHDRDDAGCRPRTVEVLDLVRVAQLLDALVEREQPTHAEQHEGDDERPEVALAPVAERVLGRRPRARARLPPSSSRPWLPVSASEWLASASRPADAVMRKPTNLAMAMPRLAKKAATIALRLPSCTGQGWHRGGGRRRGRWAARRPGRAGDRRRPGIGRGISELLAAEGATVAVNYRRDADAAADTVAAIERAGRRRPSAYQASVDDADAGRRRWSTPSWPTSATSTSW